MPRFDADATPRRLSSDMLMSMAEYRQLRQYCINESKSLTLIQNILLSIVFKVFSAMYYYLVLFNSSSIWPSLDEASKRSKR